MIRSLLACVLVAVSVADAAAQIVSERNQHDALQHYRAGEEALHGERFEAAEREFREAVKLDPLLHFAHYGLGRVYMFTRRYGLAVLAFTDAREAFQTTAARALQSDVEYQRHVDEQIRVLEQ